MSATVTITKKRSHAKVESPKTSKKPTVKSLTEMVARLRGIVQRNSQAMHLALDVLHNQQQITGLEVVDNEDIKLDYGHKDITLTMKDMFQTCISMTQEYCDDENDDEMKNQLLWFCNAAGIALDDDDDNDDDDNDDNDDDDDDDDGEAQPPNPKKSKTKRHSTPKLALVLHKASQRERQSSVVVRQMSNRCDNQGCLKSGTPAKTTFCKVWVELSQRVKG